MGGIALGIPNFGSIYFLVLALRSGGMESSTIFPVNNVAIVMISTFLGILLFRERMLSEELDWHWSCRSEYNFNRNCRTMDEVKDTYKTITKASEEVLFKDKNSKFFGYAFPVTSEEEIKEHLEELKKKHHAARHWCYAWQLGKEFHYRANDDGEPSNSAGMPIYGQIQSFDVTNVLIVVVRYFGGVKLGVGGLISL